MASAFNLSVYPWVYEAHAILFEGGVRWDEHFVEKPHKSPAEEAEMDADQRARLVSSRNSFPELPLVNFTSQYGLGCFEGLKAFPQQDGSLKLFRPDENGKRMRRSMEGLMMPGFPEDSFVGANVEMMHRNRGLGFYPRYDTGWEADNFRNAHSAYLRPFAWAEGGIGLNLSVSPSVVIVATEVGSYFDPDASCKAITTDKVRATPGGTGWIKCTANYVIPILEKKRVQQHGYMEAIFLDSVEHRYVEEGSSCNIFFYLRDGTLVTPELGDRVLPGINRKSVLQLARDFGVTTQERPITIDEAMNESVEVFVTGTAAGVSYLESITHNDVTIQYNGGNMGELTTRLLHELKGIQYGVVEDRHSWMVPVP